MRIGQAISRLRSGIVLSELRRWRSPRLCCDAIIGDSDFRDHLAKGFTIIGNLPGWRYAAP